MNVIIAYSEEFKQLPALRNFFKKMKVKAEERVVDYSSFPIHDVLECDLLILQNQISQTTSDPSSLKTNPGLEIVRDLRGRFNSGIPVALLTEETLESIESYTNESNEPSLFLIYSPGLKIISIKDAKWSMDEILSIKPLSPALVTDICEMLIDIKGYLIDKITHKLNYVPKNKETNNKDWAEKDLKFRLELVREFMNKYLTAGEIIQTEFDLIEDHLLTAQLNFEQNEYENVRKLLKDNITRVVVKRGDKNIAGAANEKFKILVLDDDPIWLNNIIETLKENFELITTSKSSEALDILDKDNSNEIRAVISDWRLYEDFEDQTYWQDVQGYDVLQHSIHSGQRALIALTSLADSTIHKIRNQLRTNISLITKDYIRAKENAELLSSIILDKCIEIDLQIASTPTSKGWYKGGEQSLHNQYIQLRSSGEWAAIEAEISKNANEVFDYYMQGIDIDYMRSLEPLNRKFGLSLKNKGVFILENCLIIRRVWLGLWWKINEFNFTYALDEYPEVKIFSIIRQRYLDEEADNIEQGLGMLSNNAKQLAYNLGIVKEELPFNGILPEEQFWLRNNDIEPEKGNISVYESDDDT